ncbi:MAG: tRNA (N(6)-L-threonylcarbamoyladenosine(37)-C(2))-methylthiotransferase MtaB [Alphaproteobacteria bacterium]|nr:tRNA (N(6)-L-threonylcarbamoyladenosine(37)-C(2))-methylthiotransferase MtaB [Alphaproteobacteria bacterium]
MSGVEIISFGCRLNAYEAEAMRAKAGEAGLSDAVIVNTCAVTAEAERQARQAIRRARRERPGARIIVTGCGAQIDPTRYAAMPEVDRVIGNREKLEATSFLPVATERVVVDDIMAARETASHLISGFESRARAFVQVQNGCDHRCTFCIIPFGRGPSRSVPVGEIAREVRTLVEHGHREVVLSGVDLGAYGLDLPGRPPLGQMVRRLLASVPDLPRLRLSSIDPVEIDAELERLFVEEPRLMPHLHLSVQAGDDLILKRMKRRHVRADVIALTTRLRAARPELRFGADLIAGFPTETEEMFVNSLRLVDEAGIDHLHVFPYSERPGTPAARMPAVPVALRKERAGRLRSRGEQRLRAAIDATLGATVSILVERDGEGRTEHYLPTRISNDVPPAGTIVSARAVARDRDILIAQVNECAGVTPHPATQALPPPPHGGREPEERASLCSLPLDGGRRGGGESNNTQRLF